MRDVGELRPIEERARRGVKKAWMAFEEGVFMPGGDGSDGAHSELGGSGRDIVVGLDANSEGGNRTLEGNRTLRGVVLGQDRGSALGRVNYSRMRAIPLRELT